MTAEDRRGVGEAVRADAGSVRSYARLWARDTWVKPFFARYGKTLAATLGLGLAAFVFAAALMFTSGFMISLAATLPVTVLALHVPSLFVRIFGLGKPILQYLERLQSHDWVLRMTSALRVKLYRVVERSPLLRAEKRLGEVLGLLSEDIGHIQDLYLRTVFPLAAAWLVYVVLVVAFGVFSLPLALAVAVLLGIEAFAVPLAAVSVNGARMLRRQKITARLYDDLSDNVLGLADWVFAGRRDDYLARFDALLREDAQLDAAIRRTQRCWALVAQALFALCAVALVVWAGLTFAPHDALGAPFASAAAGAVAQVSLDNAPAFAPNWAAAFVLALFPLFEAFYPLPDAALGLVSHGSAVERLNGYGSADDEPEEGAVAAPADELSDAARAVLDTAAADEPATVTLDRVAFSYEGSADEVLHGLSLSVPPRQKLFVLGRSGVGKSTIAALVRGDETPSTGRVTIGGVDVASFGERIARLVGVVQQSPYLFNQSLRANLLVGDAQASDEQLWAVLDAVGLGSMARSLPQGLDTMMDEAGKRFSGGERHRVALGRILLSRAPIVVLDEPFAGLDPRTEQALLDTVFDVLADRTVILITHHLQGALRADRIVFVEDGAVKLDGSPDELAATSERFRRLLAFEQGRALSS